LAAEPAEEGHIPEIPVVEDEYYVEFGHEMTKSHYISFIAAVYDDGIYIKKLYPQGAADARFKIARARKLVYYCNHHGLFEFKIKR
ncbi:MAG: XRE family transcriptional regulator, partial [Clostridia bacterium]|nr:XRE family transcriptional regulator [Clostridia bacterium]